MCRASTGCLLGKVCGGALCTMERYRATAGTRRKQGLEQHDDHLMGDGVLVPPDQAGWPGPCGGNSHQFLQVTL